MCFISFTEQALAKEHVAHSLCHRFRANRAGIDPSRLEWSGKYVWGDFLASGGQGEIALAYRLVESDRDVVIKTINGVRDAKADAEWGGYVKRMRHFQRQMQKEIKHIQRLQHPNIIKLLDSWEEPDDDDSPDESYVVGDVYQVLEKYEGDLHKLLALDCITTIKQADLVKSLTEQIVGALGYCHEQGIIHRDVKDGNILWRFDGPKTFHFVLSDFGLAKEYPGSLNGNWAAASYYWFPPEFYSYPCRQCPRGDMWMFGVVLLWIVDEAGLRSAESGRLSMKEIWERVGKVGTSGRWGAWGGIFTRDVERRMTAANLSAATNDFELGPPISGTVTQLDPNSGGAYPRHTSSSFREATSNQEGRCWHSEKRSVSPSALSPSQRCHCEEKLLEERDIKQEIADWIERGPAEAEEVDPETSRSKPPRTNSSTHHESGRSREGCDERNVFEDEGQIGRENLSQRRQLDDQSGLSADADDLNLAEQTSLINVDDVKDDPDPEPSLSEQSREDLQELIVEPEDLIYF